MIVFFLNRFNDIDHIAPVIYKVAEKKEYKITIVSINLFVDINSDFRILHIKNKFPNIVIVNLLTSLLPLFIQKFFNLILTINNKTKNKINLQRILIRILYKISLINLFEIVIYRQSRINNLLNSLNPMLFIFDHAMSERLPGLKYIFKFSELNNIPTLSLPSGLSLYENHTHADLDIAKQDMVNSPINHIVFNARNWMNECVDAGLDINKTYLLESARFSSEWKKILDSIISWKLSKRSNNGRLKVVFMDRGKRASQNNHVSIQAAINEISKLDFVDFKYKPQTRSNKIHFSISNIEIVTEYNSVDIINWADIVIGNYSSILVEALIQNKFIISPVHHKTKTTLLESYNACIKVNSNEELLDTLNNIYYKDIEQYDYSSGRKKFLEKILNFNDDNLTKYYQLINQIIKTQ